MLNNIRLNEINNFKRINSELSKTNMAYKIKDTEGNEFVFAGLENGFPVYITIGGQKIINELNGYEIIESQIK